MKIAFFTDDYLPYIHGVTRSIQAYRTALEARGHEVYIVAPKHPTYTDDDDHVIRTNSINSYVFDNRPMSIIYPGMAKKFDEYEFDIIHTQTQFWLGTLGYMVARHRHIPHISTIHTVFPELLHAYPAAIIAGIVAVSIGYPIAYKTKPVLPFSGDVLEDMRTTNRDLFDRQAWKLMNLFMDHTSLCITPSQHIADTLIKNGLRVPHDVLTNGIDTAFYQEPRRPAAIVKAPGERWVTAVGRLSAEKRPHVLVEAFAQLDVPNVRLVFVGDGPEKADLEAQARKLNISDRVTFTGNQPREEVAAILQQSELFTIASYRFDNQPMVILEAIASGLPVVYGDDRLKEGLTQDNSLLTSNPDPDGFAAAFTELLNAPQRITAMGKASRDLAPQFDISAQAERLESLYLQAKPVS